MDDSPLPVIIPRRRSDLSNFSGEKVALHLKKNADRLGKIQLQGLDVGYGLVYESETGPTAFKDAVNHERRTQNGNVVLVLCQKKIGDGQEHAIQLSEDLSSCDKKISMFCVIQEREKELAEYRRNFQNLPIYQDGKWSVGQAVDANGKSMMRSLFSNDAKGCKTKDCSLGNNFVLIFDKKARLRFAYAEDLDEKLDLEAIMCAVREVRSSTASNRFMIPENTSMSSIDDTFSALMQKRRSTMSTVSEDDDRMVMTQKKRYSEPPLRGVIDN